MKKLTTKEIRELIDNIRIKIIAQKDVLIRLLKSDNKQTYCEEGGIYETDIYSAEKVLSNWFIPYIEEKEEKIVNNKNKRKK